MKQILLWGTLLCCCASLQATQISPYECIGLDTTACYNEGQNGTVTGRSIDSYFGDPGVLVASANVPVDLLYVINSVLYSVPDVGTVVSAAYREQPNTDGHFTPLTFYYQFQANANLPFPVNFMYFYVQPNVTPDVNMIVPTEVGQRQGGLPAGGFENSYGFLSAITLSGTNGIFGVGGFVVDWSRTPVIAGEASPIFEIRSSFDYYDTQWHAQFNTTYNGFPGNAGLYSPIIGLLSVNNVPEPSTWGLLGLGLAVCLWVRKSCHRKVR